MKQAEIEGIGAVVASTLAKGLVPERRAEFPKGKSARLLHIGASDCGERLRWGAGTPYRT